MVMEREEACAAIAPVPPAMRAEAEAIEGQNGYIPGELGCCLDAGHAGPHWSFVETPTTTKSDDGPEVWVRWDGTGVALVTTAMCNEEARDDRDGDMCLLPAGHVGSHSF